MFNAIDLDSILEKFNGDVLSAGFNAFVRCLPYFHWQDLQSIANNNHPLWVLRNSQCADIFNDMACALRQCHLKTYKELVEAVLDASPNMQPLLVRKGDDRIANSVSNLEFNCEVQRDAAQTFLMLGPLGYSENVDASDGGIASVILGWEINPLSRNWLSTIHQTDKQYTDMAGKLTYSRRGEWELNYTLVPNCTLYLGTFILGGSHWLEAMEKMYQNIYSNGPVLRKWRELG